LGCGASNSAGISGIGSLGLLAADGLARLAAVPDFAAAFRAAVFFAGAFSVVIPGSAIGSASAVRCVARGGTIRRSR
jgi:hypothetical protein